MVSNIFLNFGSVEAKFSLIICKDSLHIASCNLSDKYPAICHVDNTSRVQTVCKNDNSGYYRLIKKFYEKTGCPMVLNTSLNIKGDPIVNTWHDAIEFSKKYGVKVF